MNIATAKEQIKDTVQAYLERDDAGMYCISPQRQRPIFMIGAPGIGKTAIMEQIAQELGIGIVSYSMTHHTRQSALGLPRIMHRSYQGTEYDASEYTMSEIIAAIYDYMEDTGLTRGILFLDEINCVSETLYPSMLQFLQFKTFGRHKVPDDWVIVCAGNPPEYNRSVHEFDIVTLDRLREIDVQPDYAAWRRYALEKGLHPAILTFLEARHDCFYKVESKPGGGKSFVTARGWEDLAETITLYERMGKPVNRELFAQFLRDDEITDSFSVYYSLFEKYHSDYKVGRILAGNAGEAIADRAKKAKFDERVALLGLLLDTLARSCQEALNQEDVVLELRDELQAAKHAINDGGAVGQVLAPAIKARQETLDRKVSSGTAARTLIRRERLVIKTLKELVAGCELGGAPEGPEGFTALSRAYRAQVDRIKELVEEANVQLNNAFAFIEECFGGSSCREMLVFMAELSARAATTQFIARYGNDKYYQHNDALQVDEARRDLTSRIKELEAENADERKEAADQDPHTQLHSVDMGGGVSLAGGSMSAPKADDGADNAEFYRTREFEYGYASMSRMTLPIERIAGKKVLDVCCRRGKGVYKFSAKIGQAGHVTGLDWSPSYIEEARAGSDRAAHDNHLKTNNMDFIVGYPENLLSAGVGDASYDVVYINNVISLLYDPEKALSEFHRVLKPGGLLICEPVLADRKVDDQVREQARKIGNSVQAAFTKEEFFGMLRQAGFDAEPEVAATADVRVDEGYLPSKYVEAVPDDSGATYRMTALYVTK